MVNNTHTHTHNMPTTTNEQQQETTNIAFVELKDLVQPKIISKK